MWQSHTITVKAAVCLQCCGSPYFNMWFSGWDADLITLCVCFDSFLSVSTPSRSNRKKTTFHNIRRKRERQSLCPWNKVQKWPASGIFVDKFKCPVKLQALTQLHPPLIHHCCWCRKCFLWLAEWMPIFQDGFCNNSFLCWRIELRERGEDAHKRRNVCESL